MKKLLALVLALVMVLSLAACGSSSQPAATQAPAANAGSDAPAASGGNTFRLGLYASLTGSNSAYGIELRNGVALGVKRINANGGLNGQQVELVVYDTQCSTEEAAKVAIKLIEDEKVDAIIGSMNSGEVFAAGPAIEAAGLLHFGCGTGSSWMKEGWYNTFRAAMNNDNAVPIACTMLTKMNYTKVAIFNGQEDAALTTADAFQKQLESMNIEVVARESYDAGDTDYSGQVQKMLAADPDIILISVIGETGGPIVRQLRQAGWKGLIMSKESFMNSQIEIAGVENSTEICFANPYVTYEKVEDCDIPNMQEYLQLYLDEYGTMVATDSAYRGWDATLVLEEAAKIAGSNDSEALIAATHKVVIPGLGGTLDFTAGDGEGYGMFNCFVLHQGKNILFDKWMEEVYPTLGLDQ